MVDGGVVGVVVDGTVVEGIVVDGALTVTVVVGAPVGVLVVVVGFVATDVGSLLPVPVGDDVVAPLVLVDCWSDEVDVAFGVASAARWSLEAATGSGDRSTSIADAVTGLVCLSLAVAGAAINRPVMAAAATAVPPALAMLLTA